MVNNKQRGDIKSGHKAQKTESFIYDLSYIYLKLVMKPF